MDTSKLRNVLIDLRTAGIDTTGPLIDQLINNLNSSYSKEVSTTLGELRAKFSESVVNEYAPSNLKIVEEIGALPYFGITGYNRIEEILNDNLYNIPKTIEALNTYKNARTEKFDIINETSEYLKKLDIEAHYSKTLFEVGLLMPKEFTDNKITNITKELNKWDNVFKTLKELTGNSPEDTETTFLNNGSLEFFINNTQEIAVCLSIIVERLVKIYSTIREIRVKRDELQKLGGLSASEKKTVVKNEKDFFNKSVDDLAAQIIKDFAAKQIEEGRLNELKVGVKGNITYIAKCLDGGMIIEVTPPEVVEPEVPKETESAEDKAKAKQLKQSYDDTLKKIEIVQKSMEVIKSIGKTGIDVMKYLTEGEELKDDEENDDDPKE